MSKSFYVAVVLLSSLLFLNGCQPDGPYANMWVKGVNSSRASKSATSCCVVIDCETGGSGCQRVVNNYSIVCPEEAGGVCVMRQQLDTVYHYYARNDMGTFYNRYDLNTYFPEMQRQRPGAADSLKSGNYRLYVTADSSLTIVRAPLDSIGVENIVFVYKRDAIPVK